VQMLNYKLIESSSAIDFNLKDKRNLI